jgi:hypothetical protein
MITIVFDTEFTNLHEPELISVGFVNASFGGELYIVLDESFEDQCSPFVLEHVVPLLTLERPEVLARAQAILRMIEWLRAQRKHPQEMIRLVADHSLDFQVLPASVISAVRGIELVNLARILYPPENLRFANRKAHYHANLGVEHHALVDARGIAQAWLNLPFPTMLEPRR